MADNNLTDGVEAGAVRKASSKASSINTSSISHGLEEARANTIITPIISDVFRSCLNNSSKTSSSHLSYQPQQNLQNLSSESKVQGSHATNSLTPSRRTTLAVYIRSTSSPSPSQPRRGRPPKDKNREARPESGSGSATPGKIRPSPLLSTENETGGTSPQPRKRGRPRKPEMAHVNGKEGGEEPKRTQPREAKRRGRRPRTLLPSARERYLRANAQYLPFICEWRWSPGRSCPAELQNMKTLRKHVDIVHGYEEPLVCRWGRCGARKSPIRFEDQHKFDEHMERAHFRSFVWHMGEGYQNDGISTLKRDSDGLPKYLFDKDGKQVTPSVTEQQFEDDQQYKERKRKLKRLLILQEENAPFEEEYTKQTLGVA